MQRIIGTTTLLVLTSSFVQAISLSHEEITNMVEQIKQERSGIKLSHLENTPNPFALLEKVEEVIDLPEEEVIAEHEVIYKLTAIFNHAAFINGKWYKQGHKINDFTLIKIEDQSVTLMHGDIEKQLTITKKKSLIQLKGN